MVTRTRFSPSPTGFLHVGGIRTALFSWLLARQANGQFILRLEDTDKKREVVGTDRHVMDSLKALGLDYDEGPDKGGPYAPYRQSERLDSYKQWGQKLIDKGRAYADPYAASEVQAFRDQAQKDKKPFLYRNHRPNNPPKWDGSRPLRFKSEPKAYTWHDVVMGDISTGPEVIDDIVLIKSDGYPTYNFAHIIDDQEMKISHIVRGQEFLASVPNYLNLYEALELVPPIMATVPHILGPDGNKKLSKRDGAKDVMDYIHEGYLPQALVSFIASMGWNDGSEQEVFTTQELIKKFKLDRVQRSGARFDEKRLLWTNGHFIRELSLDELYKSATDFWGPEAKGADTGYKKQILGVVQERLKFFKELPQLTKFFFAISPPSKAGLDELISSSKQLNKLEASEIKSLLQRCYDGLNQSDFSVEDLQKRLNNLLEETAQKPGTLFSIVRIATTWAPASPELAGTMAILGKDLSLQRIQQTIKLL